MSYEKIINATFEIKGVVERVSDIETIQPKTGESSNFSKLEVMVKSVNYTISDTYGDSEKEYFHKVTFFGGKADELYGQVKMGDKVIVRGILNSYKWTRKDNKKEGYGISLMGNNYEVVEIANKEVPQPIEESEHNRQEQEQDLPF